MSDTIARVWMICRKWLRSSNLARTTRQYWRVVLKFIETGRALLNVHSHCLIDLAILINALVNQLYGTCRITIAVNHIHEF